MFMLKNKNYVIARFIILSNIKKKNIMKYYLLNLKSIILISILTISLTGYTQETVKDIGIKKEILKEGKGDIAKIGQTVKIKIEGTLSNGEIFEAGVMSFQIGDKQMIPGFNEVLPTMKKGEKAKVTLPFEMGYGEKGLIEDGDIIIPPKSVLIFEIFVISIK